MGVKEIRFVEDIRDNYANYSKEIKSFCEKIETCNDTIEKGLKDLGKAWSSDGYRSCAESIKKKINKIEDEISKANGLSEKLDTHVSKLKIILEKLDSAGDN
ncbi:MAG: hypothetical protein IJ400_02640 [Clostridia bacterium]|nr:hypothetical protein [Clostridia bacterium]